MLGTGQNLLGTWAGTIDRGTKIFFRKKIEGHRLFFEKIMEAETLFLKKLGGRRLFSGKGTRLILTGPSASNLSVIHFTCDSK